MTNKNPLDKLQRTKEAVSTEGSAHIGGTIRFFGYSALAVLYGFIPWRLRWLFPFFAEDIKDLIFKPKTDTETETDAEIDAETEPIVIGSPIILEYAKYRCVETDPYNCQYARLTANLETNTCSKCGFPAPLRAKAMIQGRLDRYQIVNMVERRGLGRIYQATSFTYDEPVLIKEYLLPSRYFNELETRHVRELFENLAGLNLADGRQQDHRIMMPIEAIADRNDSERCYIITKVNYPSLMTLRNYLYTYGPLNPTQVRHFLNQTLQSLECLHEQKYQLPVGLIQQKTAHGNLSLDTILIKPQPKPYYHEPQFLVYLSDLSLWEDRFYPPLEITTPPSPCQDLIALGKISYQSMRDNGYDVTLEIPDMTYSKNWPYIDQPLRQFIFRLIEFDTPFETAAIARKALLLLPPEPRKPTLLDSESEDNNKKSRFVPWWVWWLMIPTLATLLTWWLTSMLFRSYTPTLPTQPLIPNIDNVPGIPAGKFTYAAEKNGLWEYVLRQKNLVQKGYTFQEIIFEKVPQLDLTFIPIENASELITLLRKREYDFAITTQYNQEETDLQAEVIAYDGLVVYVPFSYEQRSQGLPRYLNGQITLDQLKKLYTGEITNWKQIGGPDLPVKLYIPTEVESVQLFEKRVLKTPEAIAKFRALAQGTNPKITKIPTFANLRTILKEFEDNQIGGIGMGSLTKVFGQCTVYPLALVDEAKPPISPVVDGANKPINPSTDLCNNKGDYFTNIEVFHNQSYPLSYPIAVISIRDNSQIPVGDRFAAILKTQQFQIMLRDTGLVPIIPLPNRLQ